MRRLSRRFHGGLPALDVHVIGAGDLGPASVSPVRARQHYPFGPSPII